MQALAFAASFLVSLVAIVISIYALTFQRRLEHETSTQTLIHDQYELCRELDVLTANHPEVSHMLALPVLPSADSIDVGNDETWRNYWPFKTKVRQLMQTKGNLDGAAQAELYLKEHATALHVCDIYEQTLYQLDLAIEASDENRSKVLRMLVEYYESRMLRSLRLRFLGSWGVGHVGKIYSRAVREVCL